jgi:hypothetical protein
MARTPGPRTCEPRPLAQARQIRPAAPVGAKDWGPADRSLSRQPGRRRPIRRSGRDPVPTLRPHHHIAAEAGPEHLQHPPCRLCAALAQLCWDDDDAQMDLLRVLVPACDHSGLADVAF